jgi:pimeloyl-ACP methyl ester carboxylesterase
MMAAAVVGALAAQVVWRYRRDTQQARLRLTQASLLLPTAHGPMECAVSGENPRLLLVHGAFGGCDQGLLLASLLHDFNVIAVSRPGYLRTPLSTGRSPAEQADAYAALLDTLKIDRVAVVGGSGGGPSTLRFAIQHPDRCWALVLVSAVCLMPPAATLRTYHLWARLAPHDFLMWVVARLTYRYLLARDGIVADLFTRVEHDPVAMRIIREVLLIHPTRPRAAGLVNDLAEARRAFPVADVEAISLPTLIIHGTTDAVVPYANAQFLARTIPQASLVTVEGGGHLCIATHRDTVIPAMESFLHQHAPR